MRSRGATLNHERPEAQWLASHSEWSLPTPYGSVTVSFYNGWGSQSSAWLACRLDAWDAECDSDGWYGWDHPTQTLLTNHCTIKQFIALAGIHLNRFQADHGKGFPS